MNPALLDVLSLGELKDYGNVRHRVGQYTLHHIHVIQPPLLLNRHNVPVLLEAHKVSSGWHHIQYQAMVAAMAAAKAAKRALTSGRLARASAE